MKYLKYIFFKRKYIKYFAISMSFTALFYVFIGSILLSFGGAFAVRMDDTETNAYKTALRSKQESISASTDVMIGIDIYYAVDNVNRTISFEQSNKIFVSPKDILCFADGGKQIENNKRNEAYKCMDYNKKQIKKFEWFYKVFHKMDTEHVNENLINNNKIVYPVKGAFDQTAGFMSNDEVHNGNHLGIDLVPSEDQAIYASASGKIIFSNNNCDAFGGYLGNYCGDGFGNHIVEEVVVDNIHYRITYGHLSVANVNVGEGIKQGEPIGIIGNSGNTTGVHIHLQIERMESNGQYYPIDPISVLST